MLQIIVGADVNVPEKKRPDHCPIRWKTERCPSRRLGHTHTVYAAAFRYPTDRLFVVKISQSVTHFRPVSATLTSVDDLFVSDLYTYHSFRVPNQPMR